jgi:16S rRNA (uracil1498-N3)-methyltransferase
MDWFYAPGLAQGDTQLDPQEARHIRTVLRMREGEELWLTDGLGTRYKARLSLPGKREAVAEVLEKRSEQPDPACNLHIAIAAPKQSERMEWFLEKATELGISRITPLLSRRSERRRDNPERWQRVLIAAMKQSGRCWLPRLDPVCELSTLLDTAREPQRFIAHCGEGQRYPLGQVARGDQDALVLIGPEGDFDPVEVAAAQAAGFVPVHLGSSRLRTETAGLAAVHILNLAQASGLPEPPKRRNLPS